MFEKIPGNAQEDFGECFQFQINHSHVLLKIWHVLSHSWRRNLFLLFQIKQQEDQTEGSDIFNSFEIQIEK